MPCEALKQETGQPLDEFNNQDDAPWAPEPAWLASQNQRWQDRTSVIGLGQFLQMIDMRSAEPTRFLGESERACSSLSQSGVIVPESRPPEAAKCCHLEFRCRM